MPAPVVALSSTTKDIGGMMRVRLNEAYVDAVRAAGLIPLVVPPLEPTELASVLDAVSGIVLTGGEDIDPAEYGAEAGPKTDAPHRQRDKCEIALVRLAHERRVPTLAICRGIQVVNVALGGTLIQDIATECGTQIEHDQSENREMRVHDVTIDKTSMLGDAVGATRISVNSSHHQALARVAPGLIVSAMAPDGIREGVEWKGDDWWMLAVQWHPEELVRDSAEWDRGVFRAFAERVNRQER
jgi:putative glutamine amidotransferase